MKFLFQFDGMKIGSSKTYMFSDYGIGHITVCPEHSNVLGFYSEMVIWTSKNCSVSKKEFLKVL